MEFFIVDAFADKPFSGNQAAVVILEDHADDLWMQRFAKEINYSETAFLQKQDDTFSLRWFTPAYEVDLCGHATLATSHVLWNELGIEVPKLTFRTRSGDLIAQRGSDDTIELDFPSTPPVEGPLPEGTLEALGTDACFTGMSRFDAFIVLNSESDVRTLRPDFKRLSEISVRGFIVTSRSLDPNFDFISRFFAPSAGIDEDPVTGSAHCCLAPYWFRALEQEAERKAVLRGYQASDRGGVVGVELREDRVILSGRSLTIARGSLANAAQPSHSLR